MLITTRQRRQNLRSSLSTIYVDTHSLEEVNDHKVLGITIDNNLSWDVHIQNVCKSVKKRIFLLSQIKHFLNLKARKLFFHAYIQPLLDYGSPIWDSASMNVLKPAISVYNRALKNVLKKSSTLNHSDYKSLHILPLKKRHLLNKSMLMHKIYMETAPPTLCNLFTKIKTKKSEKFHTPIPRLDLYKTSLLYSGPVLWNSIPMSIRSNSSYKSFKEKMKMYLMDDLC